jgi:hypothetical protein
MLIPTGKYAGKTPDYLILKRPHVAQRLLQQSPDKKLISELKRLIKVFDDLPLVNTCHACLRAPTRITVSTGEDITVHFWCDAHDPRHADARRPSGGLTFHEILAYADRHHDNPRAAKGILIAKLTKAKDLARQVAVWSALASLRPVL